MPVSLSGSILITGSMTTSGTITAQTLVVQTITSSIVNMTGSNIFGSQLTDRQTFTGSIQITGSGPHYIFGSVGIGTNSPQNKLDVVDSGYNQYTLRIQSAAANNTNGYGGIGLAGEGSNTKAAILFVSDGISFSRGSIVFSNNNATDQTSADLSTERMRITSGGNVLIGTSSSLYGTAGKLEILYAGSTTVGINMKTSTSDGLMMNFLNSSGTQVGYIYSTTTTTQYATTSDYRLKEDFKDSKGLEKVSAIKIYDFKYKNSENRMDGVVAHELQEIIPYAVVGEKDGERMQGVDYSLIVPTLVKAIQEQQAQIEELKALIAAK